MTMTLPTSLFVSEKVHAREVKLADGTHCVLYFKELPAVAFKTFNRVQTSANVQEQDTSMPLLISMSLCAPDGTLALTFERACELKLEAAKEIFNAVLDVNGFGAKKEAGSAESNVSGTS